MSKLIDLTGKSFGRLTVIERAGTHISPYGTKIPLWRCICDCPKKTVCIVRGEDLRKGRTHSCGCILSEFLIKRNAKHNKSGTHLYNVWVNMKQRCYNPKDQAYKHYGGRGITICPEWMDKENGFINFYNDVSKLPHFDDNGYSLDRIDNNGNYEINNVRWSTSEEQANNKRNNILITYNGKTQTVAQWGKEIGVSFDTLYQRICKWDIDQALTKELAKCVRHKIEYKGKTQTLSEWAKETGTKRNTLFARIYRHGWSIEKALTTPVRRRKHD